MANELSQLGYSARDIATLDPSRAAAIIERHIHRPDQGMPKGWERGGKPKSGLVRRTLSFAKQVATAGLVGVLALHYSGLDLGGISDMIDEAARTLQQSVNAQR